jgi:hypothetical protein
MVDAVNALRDPGTTQTERGELQREWIVSSAESGRKAEEALIKAVGVLADHAPGRRPDDELARASAAVGEGWAVLSHAEAARSMAAAAFAVDQMGVNTFPSS